MIRKIVLVLAAAAFSFGFAGCGDSSDSPAAARKDYISVNAVWTDFNANNVTQTLDYTNGETGTCSHWSAMAGKPAAYIDSAAGTITIEATAEAYADDTTYNAGKILTLVLTIEPGSIDIASSTLQYTNTADAAESGYPGFYTQSTDTPALEVSITDTGKSSGYITGTFKTASTKAKYPTATVSSGSFSVKLIETGPNEK